VSRSAIGLVAKAGLAIVATSVFAAAGIATLGDDAPATQPLSRLTVVVTDLRRHHGQLIFGVFASADGFPTESGKSLNWQIKPADADTVEFACELPPGEYGASVLHDENSNGRMDKNLLGIPKEGYGVTNNPKPARRAATFKESRFTLPPAGAKLTISIQYFY